MTIPKIGNYRKKLIELEQAYLDIYWDNNKKCFNINKLAESPNITEHTKYLHSKFMKEFWKNNRKKMTKIVSNNLDKARKAYKRMIRDGHKFPAPNKGKKTPLSVRKKQSISAKKRGCHDVLKRPVKMLTISGRYVRTFESLSSAAIYFSGNYRQSSNIGKVCSGERKKAFGFKWEYLK